MTFILPQRLATQLHQQLTKYRRQLLRHRMFFCLPLLWLTVGLVYFCKLPWPSALGSLLLLFGLSIWQLVTSKAWRALTIDNLLLHYNRRYPQLEESAQLINQPVQEHNILHQLQQQKIAECLSTLLSQPANSAEKITSYRLALWINGITLAVLLGLYSLLNTAILSSFTSPQTVSKPTSEALNGPHLPDGLTAVNVTIAPPTYSQLPTQTKDELNLSLLAGSEVVWRLKFNHSINTTTDPQALQSYHILLSSGESIPLELDDNGWYYAKAQITQTAIYTLVSERAKLEGVYTLSVTADLAPTIRFVSPAQTTIEIAKDGLAQIDADVLVSDDFAISKVEILASIAKGSGEAVKFRDQRFSFDSVSVIDGKDHYLKHWQLSELGMEPGDEMYFSVWAWDNRQPQAQLTRSPSKIIRWLEEEQSELVSDGLLLDVMPEYFKSQRQIIIETEQLIGDKALLSKGEFKQTSQDLGFAQSDLKQKYGQFLGDEFAGEALHSMESGPAVKQTAEHQSDEHEDNQHEPEDHQHEGTQNAANDKSGFSELIEQYGHNHGEAEVGLVNIKGTPSPTALMKRAIANMWDAERHLMQSAPDLALPYEKEALKYLNQAKKADRIYVKRLGFEPPPVSESRRYQGDLKDIKNAIKQAASPLADAQAKLLNDAIRQLNQWQSTTQDLAKLSLSKEQLTQLNALLMTSIDSSPELIKHIATLEKMQLNPIQLKQDCSSCISQLVAQLWLLLPATVAQPTATQNNFLLGNPSVTDYQDFLSQEQVP
jgi:hypothetical protein